MKQLSIFLLLSLASTIYAQNIGINNANPQAALDLSGDLRLRSTVLTLPSGVNDNVDLVTTKSSIYMFAGGSLNGCRLSGFTGGVDGRMVTIFNNSTSNIIELYDESNASNNSLPANKILTGTGNTASILINGSVTLRYDGIKMRWTVVSSNYTDGLDIGATSGPWNTNGNTINNTNTGNVGIGTANPSHKLSVNGVIRSKEIIVEAAPWPDYVFSNEYKLLSLPEIEAFIKMSNHLPNFPKAKDIENNGQEVGEIQRKMMEKIEELTLHIIELNKRIEALEKIRK